MDKRIKFQLNHIQFYSQMRSVEVLPRLLLILCLIGGAHSADDISYVEFYGNDTTFQTVECLKIKN